MNSTDASNGLPLDYVLLSRASTRVLMKFKRFLLNESLTFGKRLSIVHEIESIIDRDYDKEVKQ